MEVFQNLEIFVDPHQQKEFIQKLTDKVNSSDWTHKPDFEKGYKKNTASDNQTIICIESANLQLEKEQLKAYIWIWQKDSYYEVFNIVPVKSGILSFQQYNYILNQFYTLFIKDLVDELNLTIEYSKPNKSILDLIGEDATEALIQFSRNANKSTGNTNPYDFNRWCDFIFIIHRKKIDLHVSDFIRWLEEDEGWSDDVATRLGLDLEYALNILERYEQN